MKEGQVNQIIHRHEYRAYPWEIEQLRLHFTLEDTAVIVRSQMQIQIKQGGEHTGGLELDGKDLETLELSIDGEVLEKSRFQIKGERMMINDVPARCVVSTLVRIRPAENTALEGLYQSGEFLLTQCEAEGFRKITWFPDRPDVMTRFEVTLEGSRVHYPVLLSNGNAVAEGQDGDRHWVQIGRAHV